MKTYMNTGGNSGISGYEFGKDYIDVLFSTGAIYRYSYASAGIDKVEHMKQLAEQGCGLNSYIMHYARLDYVK